MTTRFSLVTDPWIPVATLDGDTIQVSLTACFERAGGLAGVRADSLLEQRALERLLIAITYRVQGDRWDVLDVPAILDYLAAHEERFILGRFLAYSGVPVAATPAAGLDRILFDTSSRSRVPDRLPPDQAARALLTRILFDPSGLRTGMTGDPAGDHPRSAPIGAAWLSRIPTSLVHPGTLADTIRWNLPDGEWGDDTPAWEDDPDRPRTLDPQTVSRGRLLMWPSRRIALTLDDDAWATGAILAGGDRLDPYSVVGLEQHGLWRPVTTHGGAIGPRHDAYCHDPWTPLADGPLPIGIQRLAAHGDGPATISTIIVSLNEPRTTIVDAWEQRLSVDGRLLAQKIPLVPAWITIITAFDYACQALTRARGHGRISDRQKTQIRRELSQRIDLPFRNWLAGGRWVEQVDEIHADIRDSLDLASARIAFPDYLDARTLLNQTYGRGRDELLHPIGDAPDPEADDHPWPHPRRRP